MATVTDHEQGGAQSGGPPLLPSPVMCSANRHCHEPHRMQREGGFQYTYPGWCARSTHAKRCELSGGNPRRIRLATSPPAAEPLPATPSSSRAMPRVVTPLQPDDCFKVRDGASGGGCCSL
ncbi:hypothetical protein B296_00029040 [Ensete ventricosum]|uniref:Uncharacterized protein n=1 Tax=Ensete ventricosum TaxID=4639 RepID=A0A426YW35_ENSVE|nr:hypothetical protein B296_00029040 [Ensete ventricosum]